MSLKHLHLGEQISILSLVTCFYFELSKTFRYDGEKHDFWELVYVDKGEVEAKADSGPYFLKQGELVFHEPNEFHSLVSNGKIAPNIFIVTFVCNSEAMSFFKEHKMFRLGEYERLILARLMAEGLHVFRSGSAAETGTRADSDSDNRTAQGAATENAGTSPPLDSAASQDNLPTFASEQLVKIYIEMLLIQLIRNKARKEDSSPASSTRNNQASRLSEKIIAYLAANLGTKFSLQQLCAEFGVGRTQINILFKEATGSGIIEYMGEMKIEQAKVYIREEIYNFTEIAELLGYSSVHYFSRHFKVATGMTPSEYSKTIKARQLIDHRLVKKDSIK